MYPISNIDTIQFILFCVLPSTLDFSNWHYYHPGCLRLSITCEVGSQSRLRPNSGSGSLKASMDKRDKLFSPLREWTYIAAERKSLSKSQLRQQNSLMLGDSVLLHLIICILQCGVVFPFGGMPTRKDIMRMKINLTIFPHTPLLISRVLSWTSRAVPPLESFMLLLSWTICSFMKGRAWHIQLPIVEISSS